MDFRCLGALLLASVVLGQTVPAPSSGKPANAENAAKAAKDSSSTLAPDTPVITIQGVCDNAAARPKPKPGTVGASTPATKKSEDCKTVVTKEQFDALAAALQPNMNPAMRRMLADRYPRMLIFAHEARKRGLEQEPKFKQVMHWVRLQILSQQLAQAVKEEADKVPESEVEKYYKDNGPEFELASMERVFIPKEKQVEAPPAGQPKPDQAKLDEQRKKDEEAMKTLADTLRSRAASGEDFEKLQKEAYEAAGIKGTPPSPKMSKLRRDDLPMDQRSVLDLKSGEVSQVIPEANGFYIYKLSAKEMKPLEEAKVQIHAKLAQQRQQDAMQKIQDEGKTELNEAYFPAAPPTGMVSPNERPNSPTPPASQPKKEADNPSATNPKK